MSLHGSSPSTSNSSIAFPAVPIPIPPVVVVVCHGAPSYEEPVGGRCSAPAEGNIPRENGSSGPSAAATLPEPPLLQSVGADADTPLMRCADAQRWVWLRLGSLRSLKALYAIQLAYLAAASVLSLFTLGLLLQVRDQLPSSSSSSSSSGDESADGAVCGHLLAFLATVAATSPVFAALLVFRTRGSAAYARWGRWVLAAHCGLRLLVLAAVMAATVALPSLSVQWATIGWPQLCVLLLWLLTGMEWLAIALPAVWLALLLPLFPFAELSAFPPFVSTELEVVVDEPSSSSSSSGSATKQRDGQRLSREQLSAVAPIAYRRGMRCSAQCVICMTDLDEGANVRVLKCWHAYHVECIDEWLVEHRRVCPLCLRIVHLPNKKAAAELAEKARASAVEMARVNTNAKADKLASAHSSSTGVLPDGARGEGACSHA